MKKRNKFLLASAILIAAVLIYFIFIGSRDIALERAASSQVGGTSGPNNGATISQSKQAFGHAGADTRAASTERSALTLTQMAGEQHLASLLNEVRRNPNVMAQEFAVFAPARLCLELKVMKSNGIQPLLDVKRDLLATVSLTLKPESETATREIAQRCNDYGNDGLLVDKLRAELLKAGAPVSAAIAQIPLLDPQAQEAELVNVRAPFAAVFAGDDVPVKLQMLGGRVASWGQRWVTSAVPDAYKPDALLLAVIALDIATCRAGATCDGTSIARARLCARYGECAATDVEASYRRLHTLYQVPFEMTEKVVQRYEEAIRTKNPLLVLGNT